MRGDKILWIGLCALYERSKLPRVSSADTRVLLTDFLCVGLGVELLPSSDVSEALGRAVSWFFAGIFMCPSTIARLTLAVSMLHDVSALNGSRRVLSRGVDCLVFSEWRRLLLLRWLS